MARASRARTVAADPQTVWDVVSDPYHLPRWWPLAERVENVRMVKGGRRNQWTLVLATESGKGVRADYRCIASAEPRHVAWEQELADSPFERILRASKTEIVLAPDQDGTRVRITVEQRLRGLSRLGSPMMRRATRRQLDRALEGLVQALGSESG